MSAKAKKDCPHCVTGRETFWYMAHKYLYDVDLARTLVRDGREEVELDDESVQHSVDTSVIHAGHLPHVNTKYPGIIAHITYRTETGELVRGHVLIDGHHRAARCLQLKIPFFVYLLTDEESETVLLKGPMKPELESTTSS
ncbi:MAG: hypothetical protein JWN70_943 [Planctomycetaceae bacterium]|nr:hypothetical protein [Planctomycetaceae bacterium]